MSEQITDSGYRQATRNNVLLSRVIVALTALLIILVIAIASLFPLKETEWLVYEFSTSDNTFMRVAKAGDTITANDALTQMQLREYVMKRETINRVDEADRYASVMAKSGSQVANEFRTLYSGDNSPLNISGLKRAVVINRDNKIGTGSGLHQVEFTTTTTINGERPEVKEWVVSIAYEWRTQEVRMDAMKFNPTGLVITKYTIAPRSK
jgi:type IV secretory pathway component VirB8